jgi:2,5-dihydroxypyridine 5,6-dioxygenase
MLQERIEAKWIDAFAGVFRRCDVKAGDDVAILSETQSRPVLIALSELALSSLGARPFHLVVPTPPQRTGVPVRSTGASEALQGAKPVLAALGQSAMVIDCTVEGLLHAPELPQILGAGARVLMISNEHPDALERLAPTAELEPKVKLGIRMLRSAKRMHVTSPAGTDLAVSLAGAVTGGGWGYTSRPGTITHWPGGLCLCFPAQGAVNGRLVLAPGDVNLTFKRYLESPVDLTIRDDYVVDIAGAGVDAELMRSYFAAWGDKDAYAVSHLGWGMNPGARWDAMAMYDKRDFNGTELRAFAGNFLYSTGANEVARRRTAGHFDLPLRQCTVRLDDTPVVVDGVLQGDLA